MDAITVLDDAIRALDEVSEIVASHASRLTREETRDVLATVYRISLTDEDRERMIAHIVAHRKLEGANRAYVMRRSNGYTLPLRYVFSSERDRSNVSRYAGALDELSRRGVPPYAFHDGVTDHGGLTELYWLSRDRASKRQVRQKINLSRPIDVVSGKVLTLTLLPDDRGVFEVLDYRLSDEGILEAAE